MLELLAVGLQTPTFAEEVLATLTDLLPNWSTWLVGGVMLGAAIRIGPRLIKRFM